MTLPSPSQLLGAKNLPNYKEMVKLPFLDKLALTKVIVERNLRDYAGRSVVSLSGGKDSTLVLHLVRSVNPSVPVVFNNTGVEYPETVRFVHQLAVDWNLDLEETTPDITFWKCVSTTGCFPKVK